jgi:hypothetical protein
MDIELEQKTSNLSLEEILNRKVGEYLLSYGAEEALLNIPFGSKLTKT